MSAPRSTTLPAWCRWPTTSGQPDRARDPPAPPLHPDHGARVPVLGGHGPDRGQRPRPARHHRRCRHHAAVSAGPAAGARRRLRRTAQRRGRRRAIRCWRCPASGWAARGSRSSTIRHAARPRRGGAAGGERARPGDPRAGPRGGRAGPGHPADHRHRPAADGAGAAGRRERLGGGDGLPQRRGAGDGDQPVLRSHGVQRRRVSQAQWVEPGRATAARRSSTRPRPGCTRPVRRSRWWWRWPASSAARSPPTTGSTVPATSISATTGSIAGASTAMASWTCMAG